MTFQCFECQKELQSYPCACGYQPKTLQVQQKTIQVDCATPGCFTQLKIKVADYAQADLLCKWCAAGQSHAMQGHPAVDIRLRFKESA